MPASNYSARISVPATLGLSACFFSLVFFPPQRSLVLSPKHNPVLSLSLKMRLWSRNLRPAVPNACPSYVFPDCHEGPLPAGNSPVPPCNSSLLLSEDCLPLPSLVSPDTRLRVVVCGSWPLPQFPSLLFTPIPVSWFARDVA